MKIEDVEGIGPTFAAKLSAAGVGTTDALLEHGATAGGRDKLSEATGISGKLILEWVNHADLFRIDGVGSEYADLLEAAGVDTVVELATRNAENLTAKLAEVNAGKSLVRSVPGLAQVEKWIAQATTLERAVHH